MRRFSGRFRSAVIIGLQGIRARKLRTLLSMVSLFIGVLAIVAVQGAASVAEQTLIHHAELDSGRDGTIVAGPLPSEMLPTVLRTAGGQPGSVVTMTTSGTLGEPNVTAVNPGGSGFGDDEGAYVEPPGRLSCGTDGVCTFVQDPTAPAPPPVGKAIELGVVGLTGDIRAFRPYHMTAGRWLDFGSVPALAPRVVVNAEAAEGLTRYRVPAELRIDGASSNVTPQIIGVIDDGSSQPKVYVRADELLTWMPRAAAGDATGTGLDEIRVLLDPSRTDLERILAARYAGQRPGDVMPSSRVDLDKLLDEEVARLRQIFLALSAVVLLVGVAGILNVGLATVGERVEEFALRRAVGTSRLLLAGIVLSETLLTGLLTAGAAVGTAAGLLPLIARLAPDDAVLSGITLPWQAAAAGVIAGLTAGVLGGLVPAIRAARIPIATVMRA